MTPKTRAQAVAQLAAALMANKTALARAQNALAPGTSIDLAADAENAHAPAPPAFARPWPRAGAPAPAQPAAPAAPKPRAPVNRIDVKGTAATLRGWRDNSEASGLKGPGEMRAKVTEMLAGVPLAQLNELWRELGNTIPLPKDPAKAREAVITHIPANWTAAIRAKV